MDFAESKASAAREIALAFGVPPLLLGLPGDNTFSNYSEANRAFWRQTVLPLVTRVQKSFAAWLQPAYPPFRLDYNADRLEALAAERASEWARIGGASFLTLDEQREAVGYGPAPKDGLFGKYSPSQPRVPSGSPQGGRWTGGGGGGGGDGAVTGSVSLLEPTPTRVALNIDPNVAVDAIGGLIQQIGDSVVNLLNEEGGPHRGHAIQEHVGKTYSYLQGRIRESIRGGWLGGSGYTRAGSFFSLAAANKLINSVLAENQTAIEQYLNQYPIGEAKKKLRINKWFGSPTGFEAFTDRPWDPSAPISMRTTYGAAVIIQRKSDGKGYSIVTAFPFFDIKE